MVLLEKKERKKYRTFLVVIAALALISGYLLLCVMVNPSRILPNTTVNEVSLDNMTLEEAASAIEADTAARREKASLTITADEASYTLELGDSLEIDCMALAKHALSGNQKPFPLRGLFQLRNALIGLHISAFPTVQDSRILHQKIKDTGILDLGDATQTTYTEKKGKLIFTIGTAGTHTDEEALTKQILSALDAGDYETPITCPMSSGTVRPVDMDSIYQKVHKEAASADLESDPKRGYRIAKSVRGVDFDKEAAEEILKKAKEGSTVAIDLIYTEPEITTRDMKKHLFRDRLAVHTTRVGGSANRIVNIRLATAKCNGIILRSGEEFSFNNTVGEQTAETGFRKANAILGRNIIQAYGGGICQVSTTLFISALYAGLEIPERWCHNYVSSYAEPGMDAAVAWGGLDFRIANDKKYPIMLQVTYANGRLTAAIWGTKTEKTSVNIKTKVLNSSNEILEVQTTRKIRFASSGKVVTKRFESSYLNPSAKQY